MTFARVRFHLIASKLIRPFLPSVVFHTETNWEQSNQITGFYMKYNTGQKWVEVVFGVFSNSWITIEFSVVYETKYSRIDQVKFVKAAFKKFEGRESNTFDKSVTKASKVFVLESGNFKDISRYWCHSTEMDIPNFHVQFFEKYRDSFVNMMPGYLPFQVTIVARIKYRKNSKFEFLHFLRRSLQVKCNSLDA